MNFLSLLTFLVKFLIAELLIFVLGFSAKAVRRNVWPNLQELWDPLWLDGLEWASVLVLLYLGYSIPLVAVSTYVLISIVGYIARKFLR